MARMIPPHFDEQTPPGEQDLFRWLEEGPAEWTCLHSLDLAPWNRSRRTEIDFVVIIPRHGVLCLEVKSHDSIWFDECGWHLGHHIERSPLKQAEDGAKTLHRSIRDRLPGFSAIPIVKCVFFPRAKFEVRSNIEYSSDEVFDRDKCVRLRDGGRLHEELDRATENLILANRDLSSLPTALTKHQQETLLQFLRPVQRYRPHQRTEIDERRQRLETVLRAQQKPVLQLANLNKRLIVSGGAGTGKTLIAMELARRLSEAGARTGLFCFNRPIGLWLERELANAGPRLICGSVHRVLSQACQIVPSHDATAAYWEKEFPHILLDRMTDPDTSALVSLDALVLDEAQDVLMRPILFEAIGACLSGGWLDGHWTFLGDFNHQVIGNDDQRAALTTTLAGLQTHTVAVRWHLEENCRNFRIVGAAALGLSGLPESVYSSYRLGTGAARDYNFYLFRDTEHQAGLLQQEIRAYRDRGYRPSEITILSFRRAEDSTAVRLRQQGWKLRHVADANNDCTCYASVHEYKGLENKVIIVTDVYAPLQPAAQSLFYTAMTRATSSVSLLASESLGSYFLRTLTGA